MSYREDIVNNVKISNVVVITGETGCGKSTQIPHILLASMMQDDDDNNNNTNEDEEDDAIPLGEIICTQPRRISATSLARRVSVEMGDKRPLGVESMVGYSIRGEHKRGPLTTVTYCTTGILLKRLESDPTLEGVSVVVVDEVHERTVQTDFLCIALRRLLASSSSRRNKNKNINGTSKRETKLKILLMSATMDSDKISRYFGGAPVLHIPGRTFPVQVRYLEDIVEKIQFSYVEETSGGRGEFL
jgi:ATP-dependent RNA helicase DHX29